MTSFSSRIRPHVQTKLDAAHMSEQRGDFFTAFSELEHAHVLGQASTREHVRVHWHMLRFAWRNQQTREMVGQAWRLAAAAVFTPLGMVPRGNTGGADVSAFQRMALPPELAMAIDAARR